MSKTNETTATVAVTKIPEGGSGKKKAKKEKKVAVHKRDDFDAVKWESKVGKITMKSEALYWCVRSRLGAIPGITLLDAMETPHDLVEGKYVDFFDKEYAFDDGRLTKKLIVLTVPAEDREDYIYPHTEEGKKAALAFIKEQKELHKEWMSNARAKSDDHAKKSAEEAETIEELNVMVVALGGKPEDLVKAGKARDRKVAVIMALRPQVLREPG